MLPAMPQVVVRIDDELAAEVDALVEAGVVASRSDAVRLALRSLIEVQRRIETARRIADGYRRVPPDDELEGWARLAAEAMVEAEPW
jgi:Arc/MetJ-type ribon-helix-helix transcriptional regulator